MGHCTVCEAYEAAIQAGGDATPCKDYEMTDAFRDWLVDRMRGEVLGQISGAGLDRMALLKLEEE